MPFQPVKDPVTGVITMVPVADAQEAEGELGAVWTALLGIDIPAAPADDGEIDEDSRGEIADMIALAVVCGYDGDQAISEMVEDFEVLETVTPEVIATYKAAAIARHAEMTAGWEGPTDWDRLDQAFKVLDASGIVARHDLGMSVSDGADEIDDIVAKLKKDGTAVRGSVFYHRQDTERAALGGGLFLVYTGDRNGDAAAKLIGDEISAELKRQGLTVEWNGRASERIHVAMDWKRRPG